MLLNGFALGGAEQGINDAQQRAIQQQQVNQQGSFQQKSLAIQEMAQRNAQKRFELAQFDKDSAEWMKGIEETANAILLNGGKPADAMRVISPMLDRIKPVYKAMGKDTSVLDAQVAMMIAKPGFDPKIIGGIQPAPQSGTTPTQPPNPQDVTGDKMPPGQNLTAPGTQITGISVEDAPLSPKAPPTAQPQPVSDVDRYSTALMRLPAYAPPGMRQALTMRLQTALQQQNSAVEVKVLKDEDGNEHPVFIDKQKKTVTDLNGNTYVVPSEGDSGIQAIATAIEQGKQPPVTTGLYKQGAKVRAKLAKDGFDLTSANQEWQAATKQIQALNGPQMTRYVGLATSVVNTIDEVKSLAEKMKLSGVPLANQAQLAAYMQTAGNSPGGQLAARYIGAVTTLKEEFANLVQGGYAPTEAAFALANKQINENYGVQQMTASLTEVQRLIRYRLNAVPNLATKGPGSPNRFNAPQQQEQPQTPTSGQAAPVDWQTYFSK